MPLKKADAKRAAEPAKRKGFTLPELEPMRGELAGRIAQTETHLRAQARGS